MIATPRQFAPLDDYGPSAETGVEFNKDMTAHAAPSVTSSGILPASPFHKAYAV